MLLCHGGEKDRSKNDETINKAEYSAIGRLGRPLLLLGVLGPSCANLHEFLQGNDTCESSDLCAMDSKQLVCAHDSRY